jgi:glycosyltransferase involved in cell wall biosynthesis
VTHPLVVIDADVLGRQRTGDETYVENLLRELPAYASGLRLVAVTRHPQLVPEGIEPLELPARNQIARMSIGFPRLLRRLRPAAAHFQHALPLGHRGPTVLTIHDLSFERHPGLMGLRDRLVFSTQVPRSARRATRVLAVSEWTKRDLVEHYVLSPEKVVVTPNGVDPVFRPEGPRGDGDAYALFVGALEPRKDPLTALEALTRVDGLRLVVAGGDKRSGGEVREAIGRLRLEPRVELLGHVDKEKLATLYRGAACLVFPSRYEGFGLPVLEAMACGTPVVATAAGAVPEVAGDAAVLVEAGDAEALAGGIERALADRDRLVAAGLERARRFSWAETARLTADVYRELV